MWVRMLKRTPKPWVASEMMSARTIMLKLRKTPGRQRPVDSRNTCKQRRCSIWGAKAPLMSLAWLYALRPWRVEREPPLTRHGVLEAMGL
jgi:hypothetical protein